MSGANDTVERHFDSIIDFLDDSMDGNLCFEKNRNFYNEQKNKKESDWYGIPDRNAGTEEIYSLIRDGWKDGAAKVTELLGDVEIERLPVIKRGKCWSDQGDELNMDRVYAGALDVAWRRTRKALCANPPRVRIVINMSTACGVSGRDMFWRGAAALVLADNLIKAGYSVQIVSASRGRYFLNDTRPTRYLYSCVVKDWLMPMEISALASTTALAGMFRKFGFLQIIKIAPTRISHSLGYVDEIKPSQFSEGAHKTFVINGCTSKKEAMAWLETSIAAIKAMTNS